MLPKNKKIIAFDLDGTLAVSKTAMSHAMAELMKALIKQIHVVVISGGKFEQFQKQVLPEITNDPTLRPHIQNLILLPTSGSQRYEYNDATNEWQMTDKENLPENIKDKAKKLLQEVIENPEFEIPPHPRGPIVEDRFTQLSFSALGQEASVEDKRTWDPTEVKRQKIKAFLEPRLPEMAIALGGMTTLDLVQKGFNKAVGLNRLLEKFGWNKSDMLFVGDGVFPGGNDYSVHEDGIDTIAITPNTPDETMALIREWIG